MLKQAGISLISASLLLAGCGGGGSSSFSDDGSSDLTYDGPTVAVVISDTTAADSVARTVIELESSGSTSLSDATGVLTGIAANTTSATGSVNIGTVGDTARQIAKLAFSTTSVPSTILSGVTESATSDCDPYNGTTGTRTLTVTASNVVNNVWTPTPGDTIAMTFSSCHNGLSQIRNNGSARLELTTISSLDSNNDPAEFEASFVFSNLKSVDTTTGDYSWINGGFSAGFAGDGINTAESFTFSGTSLVVQVKEASVTNTVLLTSFSFIDTLELNGDFTIDHDYTVASLVLGGSVTVEMTTPFLIASGANSPSDGVVVVSGANGAKIQLTALPDATNVFIEYDLDGIPGYEGSVTKTWDTL